MSESKQRKTSLVTCPIHIAPRPDNLSAIAVIASLLGVVMKWAVIVAENNQVLTTLTAATGISELLSSMVLSFVVFNVYEFAEMFKAFRERLSWRHALFIGVICGLCSERMFQALSTFVSG